MTLFKLTLALAALIILVTAIARLNDLGRDKKGGRWWVRRIGLLFVAVASVAEIASNFTTAAPYWWDIARFMLLWGIALTWMTTPGMPPWSKYVFRGDADVNR